MYLECPVSHFLSVTSSRVDACLALSTSCCGFYLFRSCHAFASDGWELDGKDLWWPTMWSQDTFWPWVDKDRLNAPFKQLTCLLAPGIMGYWELQKFCPTNLSKLRPRFLAACKAFPLTTSLFLKCRLHRILPPNSNAETELLQQPDFPVAPDLLNAFQIKSFCTPTIASCLIHIVQGQTTFSTIHKTVGFKKCNDTFFLKWSKDYLLSVTADDLYLLNHWKCFHGCVYQLLLILQLFILNSVQHKHTNSLLCRAWSSAWTNYKLK